MHSWFILKSGTVFGPLSSEKVLSDYVNQNVMIWGLACEEWLSMGDWHGQFSSGRFDSSDAVSRVFEIQKKFPKNEKSEISKVFKVQPMAIPEVEDSDPGVESSYQTGMTSIQSNEEYIASASNVNSDNEKTVIDTLEEDKETSDIISEADKIFPKAANVNDDGDMGDGRTVVQAVADDLDQGDGRTVVQASMDDLVDEMTGATKVQTPDLEASSTTLQNLDTKDGSTTVQDLEVELESKNEELNLELSSTALQNDNENNSFDFSNVGIENPDLNSNAFDLNVEGQNIDLNVESSKLIDLEAVENAEDKEVSEVFTEADVLNENNLAEENVLNLDSDSSLISANEGGTGVIEIDIKEKTNIADLKEFSQTLRESKGLEAPVWYVAYDGESEGPMNVETLLKKLDQYENPEFIYLWKKGFSDWQCLFDTPQISSQLGIGFRRHDRHSFSGSVKIELNGTIQLGQLENLSLSGLGATGFGALPLGETVKVTIDCPALDSEVELVAKIRFVSDEGILGLSFIKTEYVENLNKIIELVKQTSAAQEAA